MERMKMESVNLTQQNIEKIERMFPNCITETVDAKGGLKKAVNFDVLRQMLSQDLVDGDEAYEFSWVGKKAAIAEANRPIRKTLRPYPDESVNWETTENLYIEGDNLEVLKLLQESYLGAVKLIYIDPPYNTGNDFVYADDFRMSNREWDTENGYIDSEGNRMLRNTDSNGRFHSDWCSMMYPRLLLARNLLSDDGLIFISIGDEEVDNLRKICDEVFGADNFRNEIVVRRGAKSVQAQFDTWDKLGRDFEYILLYSKVSTYRFPRQVKPLEEARGGTWNNHWRGTDRPTMRYPLLGVTPDSGQWRWSKERSDMAAENYRRMAAEIGTDNPSQEQIDRWYERQPKGTDLLRLSARGKPEHYVPPADTTLLNSSWMDLLVGSSSEINALFDTKVFDTAKLSATIKRMLNFTSDDAVVMDFFSGSGTTAQAVMELNAKDGGRRRFIMVQVPEACDEKSRAFKAGYKTICEIGKERIRRVGEKLSKSGSVDCGFRVLKVDSTNMRDVYYSPDEYTQDLISMLESNIKDDRRDLDLLFGCLLEWGLPLSLHHSLETVDGCAVHVCNGGDLIACFDECISRTVIENIARRRPLRAVFRDSGFLDSSGKINAGEIFKRLAPGTRVKVI